jgi:hypothetical protein
MMPRASAYALCRHTKTNGLLCQSPALVDSAFCYHHQKARRARRRTPGSGPGHSTSVLHPLRNADTILQAAAMVLSGLASNRIHPRKAGKMLYALQIAGTRVHPTPTKSRS